MNWDGIQESSREKVQSLINAFNIFIEQNHKGGDPQDERVKRQWQAFKRVIESDPANTDSHNKYVTALRNTLLKEEVSKKKTRQNVGGENNMRQRQRVVIDKTKLLAVSKDLKRTVLRNTKEPLDMLD